MGDEMDRKQTANRGRIAVGDLVTMNSQNWTTTPFLVIEKSWVKNEWIIWSAETGKLQWNEKRLEVLSEG